MTERIGVGVGLLPAAVRNPAIVAMEIAGLARLHPGRFTAAFGHGVDAWMRQIDARPADRLGVLEETVGAVRALLGGARLDRRRPARAARRVALDFPPAAAAAGPDRHDRAARARDRARAADGIVLPEGSTPAAVRWAREQAGGATTVYAWLSIGDDGVAASGRSSRAGRRGELSVLAELAGVREGRVSDEQVRALTVSGDAAACAEAIAALHAAGADSVVLLPYVGDPAEQIARVAADVLPRLR